MLVRVACARWCGSYDPTSRKILKEESVPVSVITETVPVTFRIQGSYYEVVRTQKAWEKIFEKMAKTASGENKNLVIPYVDLSNYDVIFLSRKYDSVNVTKEQIEHEGLKSEEPFIQNKYEV